MERSTIIHDFKWALRFNRLFLNAIGLWPGENNVEICYINISDLRFPFLIVIMLIGLTLPQIYALTMVIHVLPLTVDNLALTLPSSIIIVNSFILWFHRKELKSIITMMINDWMRDKSSWEQKIMLKQAGRARIVAIAGLWMTVADIIGFCIIPFAGIRIRMINNITDPNENHYFPVQTYYPFDTTRSPQFELTYILQLSAIWLGAIMFSAEDNFFIMLVFHLCGQCEILEHKMKALVPNNCNEIITLIHKDGKVFYQKIEELVQTHVSLLRFASSVEKSFNLVILVQIVLMSLTTCCLGFGAKIINNENEHAAIIQIVTFIGIAMTLLIHIFVCCVGCEILATHSVGLGSAIYHSNWYLLPAKYSKGIIPIMIRSKNPLHFTAGKFASLSHKTFLNILKTSFAYFSLLTAISNN